MCSSREGDKLGYLGVFNEKQRLFVIGTEGLENIKSLDILYVELSGCDGKVCRESGERHMLVVFKGVLLKKPAEFGFHAFFYGKASRTGVAAELVKYLRSCTERSEHGEITE